jgi:hypothetical protein
MLTKLYDVTDYLFNNEIEKVAEIAEELGSDITSTFIPSAEELGNRDNEDFSVTLYHPRHGFINKYANYDKGLTKLNIAVLKRQVDELPDEILKVAATNLEKAAAHYRIDFPEELKSYTTEERGQIVDVTKIDKTAYHTKLAENKKKTNDKKYAIPSKKKYPMDSKENIKKAEMYFNNYYRDMAIDDRIEFAKNAEAVLIENNCKPGTLIEKYAHLDYTQFNEDFKYHVKSRINMINDDNVKNLYGELIEKSAEWHPVKVASVLHKLDKEAGLDYFYGQRVEDPVGAVFGINKEAEYDIDGKIWKESDFDKIAENEYLDENTVKELHGPDKVAVLKSLPSPIRKSIADEILS